MMADRGSVTVLDYALAGLVWRDYDAVLTIEDVETSRRLRVESGSRTEQAVLAFDDLDFDDGATPVATPAHVQEALQFGRRHAGGRLLVHCQAGMCRSPAIALAILRDRMGPGSEAAAVTEIVRIRPKAAANLHVLRLADEALSCGGRLESAWMAYEATSESVARVRFLREQAVRLFGGARTPR